MEKFTLILTHYNQMNFINEALNSIFKQNYKNVELIIADDCSKEFNMEKVSRYIEKNNINNYEYKFVINKKNLGTVKTLNRAIKKASGDYILFFAADDRLSNDNVISNFVKEFKNTSKNVITAQCLMYDEKMEQFIRRYVNSTSALKLNKKSSKLIYEKMCEGCFYGSGGTCYRKEVFVKYGLFNEEYKLVEDWAYWLYILRSGEKIYYANFDSLDHREGGVSHSEYTKETIPPHIKQYYTDILKIYEKEVLPYINEFNCKQKYRILRQYEQTILYYSSFVPNLIKNIALFDDARGSNLKLKIYWKWNTLKRLLSPGIGYKIVTLFKYNRVVPITIMVWLLINFLIINNLKIDNNDYVMSLYILMYIVIYSIIYVLDIINYTLKQKKKNR